MAPFAFALIDENKHLRFPRVIAKLADELVLMRSGEPQFRVCSVSHVFVRVQYWYQGPARRLPERLFPECLRSAGFCRN